VFTVQERAGLLALAALRLGHPTAYAKGAHLLPLAVTTPLTATLVRARPLASPNARSRAAPPRRPNA
jgi:hypothetical protein